MARAIGRRMKCASENRGNGRNSKIRKLGGIQLPVPAAKQYVSVS